MKLDDCNKIVILQQLILPKNTINTLNRNLGSLRLLDLIVKIELVGRSETSCTKLLPCLKGTTLVYCTSV
jgi:hypothetical protein